MNLTKCYRLIKVRYFGYHPLEQNFINTRPKLITIKPKNKLSYNEVFKQINKEKYELNNKSN